MILVGLSAHTRFTARRRNQSGSVRTAGRDFHGFRCVHIAPARRPHARAYTGISASTFLPVPAMIVKDNGTRIVTADEAVARMRCQNSESPEHPAAPTSKRSSKNPTVAKTSRRKAMFAPAPMSQLGQPSLRSRAKNAASKSIRSKPRPKPQNSSNSRCAWCSSSAGKYKAGDRSDPRIVTERADYSLEPSRMQPHVVIRVSENCSRRCSCSRVTRNIEPGRILAYVGCPSGQRGLLGLARRAMHCQRQSPREERRFDQEAK